MGGNMPRILFVTKSQLNRGSYWRGWYLGVQLSQMGFDFTIACPAEFRQLGIRRKQYSPSLRVITLPRLHEKTVLPGIALRSAVGPLVYDISRMDVVHVCAPAFPETWMAASISRRSGKPLVVDVDDWWGMDPDGVRATGESKLEEALERNAVSGADRVLAASSLLQEKVNRHARGKASIIPNGIDAREFASLSREMSRPVLLKRTGLPANSVIISSLADSNYERVLFETGRMLHDKGRNVYLLLVGLGRSPPEGSNIVALPKMDRREWLSVILGSDASLLLMRDTIWERARFPIKLAEFMATGNPVISSAVGESRRILDEAGYSRLNGGMYVENSPEGIGRAIDFMLNEAEMVKEVSKSAMDYALNRLSWESIAVDYIREIRGLLPG